MKKIIVFMLCVLLIVALPVVASAEDGSVDEIVTEEETSVTTETELSPTEFIVNYVKEHFEEISVIGTLLLTIFYEVRKHGKLNGSIGTLNNNAVTVAEKSANFINEAVEKVQAISNKVDEYQEKFASLLDEVRVSEQEKAALQEALVRVESYLNTSKLANLEFADELANLLCLANIPNAKKEEFYSRHKAAVDSIAVAEHTEVNTDDGKES